MAVFIVREAENGAELVRLAQELRPDLIITDNDMPEMDGLMAVLRIRRFSAEVPIVMITAWVSEGLVECLQDLNASVFDRRFPECEEQLAGFVRAHLA